jgi:hypothetical protein
LWNGFRTDSNGKTRLHAVPYCAGQLPDSGADLQVWISGDLPNRPPGQVLLPFDFAEKSIDIEYINS